MKHKKMAVMIVIICILAAILAALGYKLVRQSRVKSLLELGNQYLKEEKYEEAIASYKQILAIDPKQETARENIVVAAVDWSENLVDAKEFDKAESVIAEIYALIPDARLEKKRQELVVIKKEELERQEVADQILADFSELAKLCAAGDDAAVYEYLESDAYRTLINEKYVEFDRKYETEAGTIGLYDNGDYVYFGDYDGEVRSGNGAWYAAAAGEAQYVARGSWSDDKPNGEQVATWLPDDQVMKGSVVNGLWDGAVNLQFVGKKGKVLDWPITFRAGIAQIVDTRNGNVVSQIYGAGGEVKNELSYDDPNKVDGIWGFIN